MDITNKDNIKIFENNCRLCGKEIKDRNKELINIHPTFRECCSIKCATHIVEADIAASKGYTEFMEGILSRVKSIKVKSN